MINEEQAQLRTQQIMEAQVGQLILTCARLRAEAEQLTAENTALKAARVAKETPPSDPA